MDPSEETPKDPIAPTDNLACGNPRDEEKLDIPDNPEAPYIPKTEESAFKRIPGATVLREPEDFEEIIREPTTDIGALVDERIPPNDLSSIISGSFVPLPLPVLAFFGFVLLWAGIYLGLYSAGFSSTNYNPEPGATSGPVKPIDPKVLGEKLFVGNCALCHQATGLGVPGQFPPLVGSEWVIGNAPNRLPQIVIHGIQGAIHVKNQTFNGQMPPWGPQFNDEQIAAILTYVRSAWGNSAPPITKDEVAAARKQTASRTDQWSESELLAIPPAPLGGGAPPPAGASPAGNAPASTSPAGSPSPGNVPPTS